MRTLLTALFCLGAASVACAADPEDYEGPFPTQALYDLCSRKDNVSRASCYLYIQGLIYGLNMQKTMQEKSMPVCLPDMDVETGRIQILEFIDGITGGKPSNNKDGGDWMAFMALSTGNLCK